MLRTGQGEDIPTLVEELEGICHCFEEREKVSPPSLRGIPLVTPLVACWSGQDFRAAVAVGQMLVEKNRQLMEATEQSYNHEEVHCFCAVYCLHGTDLA